MSYLNKLPAHFMSYLSSNSYFSTAHSLFYVATPKVACTTFKWWFADLVGKVDAVRTAHGSQESSPDLVIHDRFGYVSSGVTGLDAASIEQILNKVGGNFIFCLVRNPFFRIFSAWQSKWLLKESLQIAPYLKYDFMNLPVTSATEVALAFEAFLEHIFNVEYPKIVDPHVISQHSLLCPDKIDYTIVGRMEAPEALCFRLNEHLGDTYKNPFLFERRNESLIPYSGELITARSEQIIRNMYAVDFEYFSYDRAKPTVRSPLDGNSMEIALKAVSLIRGRHQRIGAFRSEYQDALHELERQLASKEEALHHAMINVTNFESQRKLFSQEMTRVEAQLSLMKDLWMGDTKKPSL